MTYHWIHFNNAIGGKYIDKNNYVYFQIKKGMYGLKQAAILAYK